ncbi:MAG TPA: helix-turn-helix domain-containing protein [Fimbriimonadaceae bacterium]|nr:helix-turn-helix domain-containing protein [Fimbriimonadaceae bacterium]
MKSTRQYVSPTRCAQTQQTRERLLSSVAEWLQQEPIAPFTLEAIAKGAGVDRRTAYRHFPSKEALLQEFWQWINDRLGSNVFPKTTHELIEAPLKTFASFDDYEGVIRASIHPPAGRGMRANTIPERRRALRDALPIDADPRLEAIAHLLYSAAAWETMRDYAGLSGREAGEAASWALDVLIHHFHENTGD